MTLIFETPPQCRKLKLRAPSSDSRIGVWMRLLEPLKKHPGQWVKVRKMRSPGSAQVTASMLRAGDAVMPKGKYEFASSSGWLYAKYLG